MGEKLKRQVINPDIVFTSSTLCAVATAKIICEKLCLPFDQIIHEAVIYHADPSEWLGFIGGLDDQWGSVMAFGHNPGLTKLVADVWGLPVANIPTCGIISLTFGRKVWAEAVLAGPVTASFDYPRNKSAVPEVLA